MTKNYEHLSTCEIINKTSTFYNYIKFRSIIANDNESDRLRLQKFVDKDVQTLFNSHARLVTRIASQVQTKAGSAIELEDLVQIGLVALIEAAQKYKNCDIHFVNYVKIRAKGAMIDHYRKISIATRATLTRRKDFTEAYRKLYMTYGRKPTDREIGNELGLTPTAVRRIEVELDRWRVSSLDETYSDTSIDFAADMLQQDEAIDRNSIHEQLTAAIAALPDREATILQLIYFEDMSLEEVGAVFNVTAARVCQIKKAALSKIRNQLATWQFSGIRARLA